MKKKSTFVVLAEAIAFGKLGELPNSRKFRKLQKEELTKLVREEFEDAKCMEDMKVKETPFQDAALANEIQWAKMLELDKAFKK